MTGKMEDDQSFKWVIGFINNICRTVCAASMPGKVCWSVCGAWVCAQFDCENLYNLFQMVGAMTHINHHTMLNINIIFKCSDDKSEHETIKANSNDVNSCERKWRIEIAKKVPARLLVTGAESGDQTSPETRDQHHDIGRSAQHQVGRNLSLCFYSLCVHGAAPNIIYSLFWHSSLYLYNLFWLTLLHEWYNQRSFIKFIKNQTWVSSKSSQPY